MTVKEYNKSVEALSDNIYRFILKNTRNVDVAHDIVQETFMKLWNKVEMVNFEKVKSYLFTTAYRTMIDHYRRESRLSGLEAADFSKLSHTEQYNDLSEIIDEAVKQLPEVQRTVILLRDYEGYSYKEIGDVTGLNESQVKVYIYRARVTLKKYIGSLETVI